MAHVFDSQCLFRTGLQSSRSSPNSCKRTWLNARQTFGSNRLQGPVRTGLEASKGQSPAQVVNRPSQQQGPPRRQGRPAPTARPGTSSTRKSGDEPLMNEDIRFPKVRVLNSSKEMLGVMSTSEAMNLADELETDLILLNPDADPPLTRLVELSKYKYELAKADKNQRKKQRENRQDLKELKFRPNTDIHDYNVRLKNARKFLSKGDKVKLTMQFKGREMEFKSLGREMFERFIDDIGEEGTVAQNIAMSGYTMTLIMSPVKK